MTKSISEIPQMAKRRKPEMPFDRNSEEAWIPAAQLPTKDGYGWSERVLVCQFVMGDWHATLMLASWQQLPDFPKEYQND